SDSAIAATSLALACETHSKITPASRKRAAAAAAACGAAVPAASGAKTASPGSRSITTAGSRARQRRISVLKLTALSAVNRADIAAPSSARLAARSSAKEANCSQGRRSAATPPEGGGNSVSSVNWIAGLAPASGVAARVAAFAAGNAATTSARLRFSSVAAPTAVINGTARAATQPPSSGTIATTAQLRASAIGRVRVIRGLLARHRAGGQSLAPLPSAPPATGFPMADSLTLELADFEHMVHTGIFSEETGRPQPLRFSVAVTLKPIPHYDAETSL